jgi:integrative and conjugative element protein (TIGR02256 family)
VQLNGELSFSLSGPPGLLTFSASVLTRFEKYRQKRCFSKEAGGQLFAQFGPERIRVQVATGPYASDKRSRYNFAPDRNREQRDIDHFFPEHLHFVGNWHTHPQHAPKPSETDILNTRERFNLSDHSLQAFVIVIVGLRVFPGGLYVALIDSVSVRRLAVRVFL